MLTVMESWKSLSLFGKTTSIVTFVGIVFGAVAGFTPALSAWDDMGLPTLATRAWVRDDNGQLKTLVSILNAKQADLQTDNINGKIEAATAARNKIELDKLAYDDRGKVLADQEMRRLQDTIDALTEQKRAIHNPRGPR